MSALELAHETLRALLDAGVRDFVLSPGSRNTPLSLELAAAERAGILRLHVRIDERSASFLALGLAKAGGLPAAVVTTSGTAVANLHPAVVEASMSHTPIVVISANRPLGLLGTGANQTIDQVGMFGAATRAAVHLDDQRSGDWAVLLKEAVTQLTSASGGAGPVQIDLGFTAPLVPDAPWRLHDLPDPQHDGNPREQPRELVNVALPPRTLVVVAECGAALATSSIESATAAGFPVHVEASSALGWANEKCLRSGAFLLSSALLSRWRPEHLVIVGRPTLGRAIPALATAPDIDVTVVHDQGNLADAFQTGHAARLASTVSFAGPVDPEFAAAWRRADVAAATVIDEESARSFDAGAAAHQVADTQPGLLVVASSNPIRDVDARAVRRARRVLLNRGAAGIDGMVSTAIGAALAYQRSHDEPVTALLGDLAFLHDSNGLLVAASEPRPDLNIVVINNDGGAIFASLEQGAPAYAEDFERVFGTPLGVDIAALCAASGTPHVRCRDRESLRAALAGPTRGIRVIEVQVSRDRERERRADFARRVIAAADAALA
ncbi:MAG: 2-succinyl-5-enolpyruvyl-6-hydroxy-3-cyclohexene-1-carboxylic-acid synthase [Cumulibacter sp.]